LLVLVWAESNEWEHREQWRKNCCWF